MKNEYVGNFMFHPVGHGLFYSGVIKNLKNENQFSFIYDCGGKTTNIVNNSINKSNLPYNIDLLIISHFHADHIRGIFELKQNHKIKRVVLPYLDEASKIVYLASLQNETKEREQLTKFILEPEESFDKDTNVYFINEDLQESNSIQNIENHDDFQFSWTNCTPNVKNEIPCNAYYKSRIWAFHFYMPKKAKNYTELEKFFKDEGIKLNNAIDNWCKIKGKMKDLKLNNNISNVICAHGPSDDTIIRNIHSNKCFCKFCCIFNHRIFYNEHLAYQFLTGDAEIDNQEDFLEKFQDELKKSILFQVPHHGSKENWHDWFAEHQPYCNFWPVTHNANHKYNGRGNFPSATFSFVAPYSITEIESTKFGMQIFFIER